MSTELLPQTSLTGNLGLPIIGTLIKHDYAGSFVIIRQGYQSISIPLQNWGRFSDAVARFYTKGAEPKPDLSWGSTFLTKEQSESHGLDASIEDGNVVVRNELGEVVWEHSVDVFPNIKEDQTYHFDVEER